MLAAYNQPIMQDDSFTAHLATLDARWEAALAFAGFDACVISSGQSQNYFLDDQAPTFRANPHFAQWLPNAEARSSALLIQPGQKPRLFFYQPTDYWHQPPEVPATAATFDVEIHPDEDSLLSALQKAVLEMQANRIALVGEGPFDNFPVTEVNPVLLMNHLHHHRAYKTEFELDAMRGATRKAVPGHIAAREEFYAGGSEFAINLAYLSAARHTADELPYSNIVALNEHAGILHYQHYDRSPPANLQSFLIDAGARVAGYASDITRTYANDPQGLFAEIIGRLDTAQQALIDSIRPGGNYLDLHVDMHRTIGRLLADTAIVTCSAETAFESGITERFMPHGLGHLIGLQTHDVGGQSASVEGGHTPPPGQYPALRLTRPIELDMVFTIEPGVYFIPQLLAELRTGTWARDLNWPLLETLVDCGGVRIEDNVLVKARGVENFTRDAFAAYKQT